MASNRFHGEVGFGESVETKPGVFRDKIVEVVLEGDILQNSRNLQDADKLNKDISVGNQISVVADAYAGEHFHAIRYVKWAGVRWSVPNVTPSGPRLLLRLGGVYNGPGPS